MAVIIMLIKRDYIKCFQNRDMSNNIQYTLHSVLISVIFYLSFYDFEAYEISFFSCSWLHTWCLFKVRNSVNIADFKIPSLIEFLSSLAFIASYIHDATELTPNPKDHVTTKTTLLM